MIRPFTCICLMLAGGSGLYLYQSKHQAQLLDREITRVQRHTEAARDRIGVLRTEWAMLNEPERLAELSQQHLGLRTLEPTQFVAVADLGTRLPVAPVPGMTAAPGEDQAAAIPLPAPLPPPAPRATAPVQAAAPRSAPRTASRSVPEQREERAPVQVVAAMARPVAPPASMLAVAAAPSMPVPRPLQPAPILIGESVTRASALGGNRAALPPPTPYSAR